LSIGPSWGTSVAQHHANEIHRILRAQLFHDMQTMDLDGPPANSKISCRLLAGSGGYDLIEHVAFALREPVAGGEGWQRRFTAGFPVPPEALRAGIEYNEAGFNLRLAVNAPVSALMQLRVPAIVREYHRVRDDWPGLILEVTEDEILDDPRFVQEIAIQLKLYGVLLSIDDFGHAYSSLARIKSLPVAELKIDSSFASNCAVDLRNAALCQTVVDLAHRFGCLACAEGIETMEELRTLHAMGCDYGQGFLLAAPMPKSQLIQALQQRARQPRGIPRPEAPVLPPSSDASPHQPSSH
jgi:EAL domain-containing protein (putative c-di-GMP-specific phosphodiesterase class I)